MDPQATWNAMIASLVDGDREAASEYANSLLEWLDRSGFSPTVLPQLGQAASDPESPTYELDRKIVLFVCASVRTNPSSLF